MKHRQIRRELEKSIRSVVRKNALPIVLRDYQRETLISTANWLRNMNGSKAAYVQHPTGSGKTVLFATMVSSAKKLRCLIVVPSKLLVSQTVQEIVKFTKHSIGHVSGLGKIHDDKNGELIAMKGTDGQRIVVTTDASFKSRAKQLAKEFDPHVVIRDECHWSYTERSQQATELFPQAIIIGYSATPDYLTTIAKPDYIQVTLDNGQVLYVPPNRMAQAYYPTLLDRRTLRWGIEHEYLAPLAWGFLEFNASLDGVPVVNGPNGPDYDSEELAKMMEEHWSLLEEVICRLYQDNAYNIRKRQVCASCPSVAQAESLARKIAKYVPSACVSGKTPNEERDEILKSFDSDRPTKTDYRFVSSVFVLREGWNARNAEIALMLRPTKSRTFYEQFMGRIMRLRRDGRKKIALVLDLLFTGTKLAPLNAPALYGVPGERIREGGILIAPKRKGLRIVSPYLPKNVRPRVRVVQVLDIDRWVNPDGFLSLNGDRWATGIVFASFFGCSMGAISKRMSHCRSIDGKSRSGADVKLYSLKDMQKACADLQEKKVSQDGFLQFKGELWGAESRLSKEFRLGVGTIRSRRAKCRSIKGRSRGGQPVELFSLNDMKKACASLMVDKIDAKGFLRRKNESWGISIAFATKFHCSESTVKGWGRSCRTIHARGRNGVRVKLYSLKDMEKLFKENRVDVARKNGIIQMKGEEWGHRAALVRHLRLLATSIDLRLHRCRCVEVSDGRGRKRRFYSIKDVRDACRGIVRRKKRTTPRS